MLIKTRQLLTAVLILLIYSSCDNNPSLKNKAERFIKDSLLTSIIDRNTFSIATIRLDSIFQNTILRAEKLRYSEELEDYQIRRHNVQLAFETLENQSLKNQEAYKLKLEEYKLTESYLNENIAHLIKAIDSLNKQLLLQDSLHHIDASITYNVKSKPGESIFDSTLLSFYPKTGRFQKLR